MVRMKLGLYHSRNNVADGEVEYKNISIEGPAGIIRTSSMGVQDIGLPEGVMYVGCVGDAPEDRLLDNKYKNRRMTIEVSNIHKAQNLVVLRNSITGDFVRLIVVHSTLEGGLNRVKWCLGSVLALSRDF